MIYVNVPPCSLAPPQLLSHHAVRSVLDSRGKVSNGQRIRSARFVWTLISPRSSIVRLASLHVSTGIEMAIS